MLWLPHLRGVRRASSAWHLQILLQRHKSSTAILPPLLTIYWGSPFLARFVCFAALALYFCYFLAAATHCSNPPVMLLWFLPAGRTWPSLEQSLRYLGDFMGCKKSVSGVAEVTEQ